MSPAATLALKVLASAVVAFCVTILFAVIDDGNGRDDKYSYVLIALSCVGVVSLVWCVWAL